MLLSYYIHQRYGKGDRTNIVSALCIFIIAVATFTVMAVAQMKITGRQRGFNAPVGRDNSVKSESKSGTVEIALSTVMGKTEYRNSAEVEASMNAENSYVRTVEGLAEPVTGFVLN